MLQHDQPLPKHLLMSSSTGRYHPILCKKAASKVSELIKNYSVFCLLENHSYISFLKDEAGHPTSFYVIKVTSKPPCLVVWVAFLGGIPGSERHKIVSDLSEKLRDVTMKQRVTWRDLPPSKIKPDPLSSHDKETESPSRSQVSSASQFPDVYSCLLLSKPVEKILVRYDNVPSDYCSLLGPLHRSRTLAPGQRDEIHEKNKTASAAFLTLSRYLNHQRWIYSLQNSPCVSISPAAVSRILNTVCKARIQEGFSFAHSSRGIQNLVLEVPMKPEDENSRHTAPQSCVIQYIIFPPHVTTSSSGDSLSDEEFQQDSNKDDASTEAEGEVQIILEVWTEPQDGVVTRNQSNPYLTGKHSNQISSALFSKDLECVSTLVTFEHLIMMCQNPCVPSPLSDTFSFPPSKHDIQSTDQSSLHSIKNTIQQVPFAFDLLNLLPKAHQTEMIFSLFIQDLTSIIPESVHTFYNGLKPMSDRPNEMLFESFLKDLTEVTDRELNLSGVDCKKLPDLIKKRQTSSFHFQSTIHGSCRQSFHSSSISSHLHSTSRRFPSGNSANSSRADTNRDTYSRQDCSASDCLAGGPKWKCFLKAISPTHMVFTLVPATYEDLKILTLCSETLDGSHPDIIDIIQKELPTECKDMVVNLDDISINSSIPNLETINTEPSDLRSPRFECVKSISRQRSGSDVFEMNRPKLPTVRKTSGDPAVMRDRTVSLDGLTQFRAKAMLRKKLKEARERDSKDNADLKNSSGEPGDSRRTRNLGRVAQPDPTNSVESIQSPSPLVNITSKKVVGSMAMPIYIYDCNILGLTSSLIYREGVEKPKNHHLNFLFKPELHQSAGSAGANDRSQKTPEPDIPSMCDGNVHIDKDVKNWYLIIKTIYFKSFVSVLFRSLQLKLPVHSYDIQHAIDYCDNDSSYDLELEAFVKAVCPHFNLKAEKNPDVLDVEAIKADTSCFKQESWHKLVQKKFCEIVGSKFKVVPGLQEIFFFCPPGLELGEVVRIGSRRRDETKSSESTSRPVNVERQKADDDDDKTIEFRSNASQQSLKLHKHGSFTETEVETGQRDFQSSLSSVSNFGQEWDSDDEDLDHDSDEFSPPLFIQFSFALSQRKEDIISVPVSYLPSCLCEIFQDKNIPDPEQDISVEDLGLRIDIICMTLPLEYRNITDNVVGLRSTSLCSTMSIRDSRSIQEEDVDLAIIEDDHGSDHDVLSHLPTYQHKAVMDIKEELTWMLMDEIAFALSKTSPLSYQNLDFISKHVQASTRERAGSFMETLDFEFVFGSEKSLEKFKEHFGKISLQGFVLKQESEFYYLGR